MFLYTSGSTGRPKGVVLSHYSHLWAMSQRVRRPVPQGQRSLVAAPLYHMNGLAMCQTTFSQGDTVVLLPQFTTTGYIEAAAKHKVGFMTSVPTMIAMMLREKELLAKTDLSAVEAVRMGSAPITQSLIDQVRQVFPKAAISNGYGTTEAGPVVFGPHPQGHPAARAVDRLSASRGPAPPRARRQGSRGRGRAPDEVRRADDALSQAARDHGQGDDAGRLLPHQRRVPPRRRTASSISSAGSTTCSSAAARTSIRARSRRCWRSIPASTRPPSSRCPTS